MVNGAKVKQKEPNEPVAQKRTALQQVGDYFKSAADSYFDPAKRYDSRKVGRFLAQEQVGKLESKDPAVRLGAANALAKLGNDAELATVPLCKILATDSDERLRAAVATALGRIDTRQSREILEEARESEKSPLVRKSIEEALARKSGD